MRSLAAQPPLRPVTAGEKAQFFVDTRQRAYRWAVRRVGGKRAVRRGKVAAGKAKPLRVMAPRGTSGLYFLDLESGADRTSVPFLVQARDRANLLVVVPAITWLGTDPVDDPPVLDGIPDTLDRAGGDRVRWPRVFAAEDASPPGLKSDVVPLLRFLDRSGIRYDITSDLDLALSENPRASDRRGVLLAGSQRWVTRPLARRLRKYASEGGHVATFGADTLRRGVTLTTNGPETAGELLRPTQPSPQDPFGATFEPLRRTKAPAPIAQLAGDPAYGLLTGSDGTLDGFSAFEDTAPPESDGREAARRARRAAAGAGSERAARRRHAGAALRAHRDAARREGPRHPRRPAAVGRAARGHRDRAGHAQHRGPAARQVAEDPDLLGPLGAEPAALDPERLHALVQRAVLLARRGAAGSEESAPRASAPPRAARPARRREYQSSASGCSASSARASGYCCASKTTIALGRPGSRILRAWPAAIRSRSSPGRLPVVS